MKTHILTAALFGLTATTAVSAPVSPIEYRMVNGDGRASGGSLQYWDESYDGPGAATMTDGAFLTGGTGDLTDGIIATTNWNAAGQTSATPYVGWLNENPVINFLFDRAYDFTSVTFYFDASNAGGVAAPASVTVGSAFTAATPPLSSNAPFAMQINLDPLDETDALQFTINRGGFWTFLSEVTFDAAPVPVPASGLLLIAALGGLATWRRKQS